MPLSNLRPIRITTTGGVKVNPTTNASICVVAVTLSSAGAAVTALLYDDNAATSGKEVHTFKCGVNNDSRHFQLPGKVYLNNGGFVNLSAGEITFWVI